MGKVDPRKAAPQRLHLFDALTNPFLQVTLSTVRKRVRLTFEMGGCATRENLLLHALLQETHAVPDALELSSCDVFPFLAIVVKEHTCGIHVEQIASRTTKGSTRKHTNMPKAFSL